MVLILTEREHGNANLVAPYLNLKEECIVLFHDRRYKTKRKRQLKKISKKGLIGPIIGWFFRKSYSIPGDNIFEVCAKNNITLLRAKDFNEVSYYISQYNPKLILSLGNGYIPKRIFTTAPMWNVHFEKLPEYRNAQPVIWSLFKGKSSTAYTIHEVNETIDGGRILFVQTCPVRMSRTLYHTIQETYISMANDLAKQLLVLIQKEVLVKKQKHDQYQHFTTPTVSEWLIIYKEWRKLKKQID